jgi:hypothetical protein
MESDDSSIFHDAFLATLRAAPPDLGEGGPFARGSIESPAIER